MDILSYTFFKIPDVVFKNRHLSSSAKLVFAYLLRRESLLVSQGKCFSGDWFPSTYEAMASPLGRSVESIRKNDLPQLREAGLIETKTKQGFDRRQWIPKRECLYMIRWETIINNQ
ncbi:MAG: hypothetical protein II102_04785 [Bacteroidales bacterium]|nr:hypothetical protein [Bacteroidales bacterium]